MSKENVTASAPVHRLAGPYQNDGLNSPDYHCRDYELLERRYKMTGWDSSQQGIYEAGWEAAIRYYWDLFNRPSRGNVREREELLAIADRKRELLAAKARHYERLLRDCLSHIDLLEGHLPMANAEDEAVYKSSLAFGERIAVCLPNAKDDPAGVPPVSQS